MANGNSGNESERDEAEVGASLLDLAIQQTEKKLAQARAAGLHADIIAVGERELARLESIKKLNLGSLLH
jgi:hypothetical protein